MFDLGGRTINRGDTQLDDQTIITDYGTGRLPDWNYFIQDQCVTNFGSNTKKNPSLIVCRETPRRTVSEYENGLSQDEIKRCNNASKFLERTKLPLFWAVVGDDTLNMQSGEARREFDRFLRYLSQKQERKGFPKYSITVLESSGGLHANIVFVGNEEIAKSLCRSFGNYMRSGYGQSKAMQPVTDIMSLATHYLSKERTTQANYALGWSSKTRVSGSHKIEGGGDRVRLSPALAAAAIADGFVEPWAKTRAKRAPFIAPKATTISRKALHEFDGDNESTKAQHVQPQEPKKANSSAVKPIGQLCLFPEMEKPIARLSAFAGGSPSPSVILEIEHRIKRLGLSQTELGKQAGLSQPQIANVLGGRFGLSRLATNRMKAVLLSGDRMAA